MYPSFINAMEKTRIQFTGNVQETLLIPLWMRAVESRRKDALFHDTVSCSIVERIDYDFRKFSRDRMSMTGVAVRTRYLDDAADSFISSHENPVVVLLGCGLDPRVQRLSNAGRAVFYELDLPDVISLRETLLPQTGRDRYISCSMLETEWMDSLRERHPSGQFLFICEGVFMYFTENEVRQVLADLAARFRDGVVYFERMGRMASGQTRHHKSVGQTDAQFRWGCDDPHEVERWNGALELLGTMYYCDYAPGRWGLAGRVMRMIPPLRLSCGIWSYRFR